MHNKVQNILLKNQQISSSAFCGILADQQVAEFSRKFSVLGCPTNYWLTACSSLPRTLAHLYLATTGLLDFSPSELRRIEAIGVYPGNSPISSLCHLRILVRFVFHCEIVDGT